MMGNEMDYKYIEHYMFARAGKKHTAKTTYLWAKANWGPPRDKPDIKKYDKKKKNKRDTR